MIHSFKRVLGALLLSFVVSIGASMADSQLTENPLMETLWQLEAFEHPAFPADEPLPRITLGFYADGSSGGHAGCNIYGSGYVVEGDSIAFEGVFSTMMACMEGNIMAQEIAYTEAINAAERFEIVLPDADAEATATPASDDDAPKRTAPRLHLYTRDGKLLVFAPYVNFVGTAWQLVSLDGETPDGTVPLTLELDEEGFATGSGGCNQFSTTAFVSSSGMLSFGVIASTRMACLDGDIMAQEQAYLTILEAAEVTTYNPDTQELTLTSDAGTLVFVPVAKK